MEEGHRAGRWCFRKGAGSTGGSGGVLDGGAHGRRRSHDACFNAGSVLALAHPEAMTSVEAEAPEVLTQAQWAKRGARSRAPALPTGGCRWTMASQITVRKERISVGKAAPVGRFPGGLGWRRRTASVSGR